MKVAVLKESKAFEERVACTPETTKKIIDLGIDVNIESQAGSFSSFSDSDFITAGALIKKTQSTLVSNADLIFSVRMIVNILLYSL